MNATLGLVVGGSLFGAIILWVIGYIAFKLYALGKDD